MQCPRDSFLYNATHCACNPGYLYTTRNNTCFLFSHAGPPVELNSGVESDSTFAFPGTVFSFDSITRFTQSQAVFLEATLVMLLSWLGFCLFLRFCPLRNDGRSIWFRIRWWISRCDVAFATRHWLQDQSPVVKRKTELGGTFSMASWILFVGLFAALLYQIISNRSVEVHNVRATNGPDLDTFLNDLQFNITTISSMSCANLRGLGTLVMGNPAFIDHRVVPLSTFANYSCLNTTMGPTITLQCTNCRLIWDVAYVSWSFVDLPNNPATAVGFQFNLTAVNHGRRKHLSFVTGTVKNASSFDDRPITFRGAQPNILKFNLFPRIYRNLRDLKLIQPLFHEFLPGSYFGEASQLQGSLESSNNGLVNTTLYINFLSSYIVEIENRNILGPVSFLADLGGLYCISIGIFFYLLVQCEFRIKRLRNEDTVMRNIRSRRRAQDRWEKLRRYVHYTWVSNLLDDNVINETDKVCCTGVRMKTLHHSGSSRKRRLPNRTDSIALSIKNAEPEHPNTHEVQSCLTEPALNLKKVSFSEYKQEDFRRREVEPKNDERGLYSHPEGSCQNQGTNVIDSADIPPLPPLEFGSSTEISLIDLQKNLQKLYDYNVMLREKLLANQETTRVSAKRGSPSKVQ